MDANYMIKLAELGIDLLDGIYELTYKYGWMLYDEEQLGWLPDKAYNEKSKVEQRLSDLLTLAFNEIEKVYEDWLSKHTREGWVGRVLVHHPGSSPQASLFGIMDTFKRWGLAYENVLYEIVARELGGVEGYLQNINDRNLVESYESYAHSFINDYFLPRIPEEAKEAFLEEWYQITDRAGYIEGIVEMLKSYNLMGDFRNWLSESGHFNVIDALKGQYTVDELKYNFTDYLTSNFDEIMNYAYDVYMAHFPGIGEGKSLADNVQEIQELYNRIIRERHGNLKKKIQLFQLALTTAHHHGTMADHLLDLDKGKGVEVLDWLSSGPKVEKWDKELEKVLGHPRGEPAKEAPTYWITPDEDYERRILTRGVSRNHSLRLAAALTIILYN
jgi:hypothetical protein